MFSVFRKTIGKYPVSRLLGEGATGSVYLAKDPFLNRQVAIKVAHPDLLKDERHGAKFRRMMLNEASLVGKLKHPHIVEVLDAVTSGDEHYLVMEYVAGGTLEPYTTPENLLPVERVVEIVFKCCGALDYAYRHGLIHRDLKPANIMLAGETDIKVTDFGAAFALNADQTQVIGAIGSPAYMSPEQVQEQTLTHHTDIYSLGVVLFQLLTGHLPFMADNHMSLMYQITTVEPPLLTDLRPELPEALQRIVSRALQKEREARYPHWSAFASDLANVFAELQLAQEAILDSEKFNALRRLSFFASFDDSQIWEVVRMSSWKRVQAGARLIHEGRHGHSFYILAEGEAAVYKQGHFLARLTAGECVGEMSYLNPDNPVRSATVVAVKDCLVLKIRREALEAASDGVQSRFDRQFIGILVNRLNNANERLAEASA